MLPAALMVHLGTPPGQSQLCTLTCIFFTSEVELLMPHHFLFLSLAQTLAEKANGTYSPTMMVHRSLFYGLFLLGMPSSNHMLLNSSSSSPFQTQFRRWGSSRKPSIRLCPNSEPVSQTPIITFAPQSYHNLYFLYLFLKLNYEFFQNSKHFIHV